MFGHEAKPSKVFKFGARLDPQTDQLIRDQMRLMHRYYNKHVEIERERRERVNDLIRSISPELESTERRIAELEQQIEEKRKAIKAESKHARKKVPTPQLNQEVKDLRAEIKPLRAKRKELRQALFDSEQFKAAQQALNEANLQQRKEARRQFSREEGLFSENYKIVEGWAGKLKSGPPPKFRRWDGGRMVGVQLVGGASMDQLRAGDSRQLHILDEQDAQGRNRVLIRVGTEQRAPVWASAWVQLHRQVPGDCLVKWAYLVRKEVATHEKWSLQLVCSRDGGFPKPTGHGEMCAVDVGWRQTPDGLRVAKWVGDDGDSGELILPDEQTRKPAKCEQLQSIRDDMFNHARDWFAAILKGETTPEGLAWLHRAILHHPRRNQVSAYLPRETDCVAPELPDWFAERVQTLSQWRSPNRLAALLVQWRDNRFAGDEAIWLVLETWRKQDKHLYEWTEHQRQKFQRWRKDMYRKFADDLAKRYRVIVVEDCKWSQLSRVPEPEDDEQVQYAKGQMRLASPYDLIETLAGRFAETVRVDPKHTTQQCSACGKLMQFDAALKLINRCRHCGTLMDQDENAARNLLSAATPGASGEAAGV